VTGNELGARLVDLRDELDLPDGDLVEAVLAEIDDRATPGRGAAPRWLVAAAVVAIAVLAAVAIQPSREAMAGWLGIGSTRIERVPDAGLRANATLPDLGNTTPVDPDDSPLPALDLPDAAFVDAEGVRSYVWVADDALPALDETDVGAILSVRAAPAEALSTKLVGADDLVEPVDIAGSDGLWIRADHVLLRPDGTRTLAHRVLLWVDEGIEYRLETSLDKDDAVSLAENVEGTIDD
jgi:hypothetical protein